jgi:DNA-binding response OmpR family regulator
MARILVIEDDREIRANLARFLVLEGHEVLQAGDGATGVALAAGADLVLCDLLLPGLDGFGVLQALRTAPATAALPVLIVTASAEGDVADAAARRGADGCLVKPFDLRLLGQRVHDMVGRPRAG